MEKQTNKIKISDRFLLVMENTTKDKVVRTYTEKPIENMEGEKKNDIHYNVNIDAATIPCIKYTILDSLRKDKSGKYMEVTSFTHQLVDLQVISNNDIICVFQYDEPEKANLVQFAHLQVDDGNIQYYNDLEKCECMIKGKVWNFSSNTLGNSIYNAEKRQLLQAEKNIPNAKDCQFKVNENKPNYIDLKFNICNPMAKDTIITTINSDTFQFVYTTSLAKQSVIAYDGKMVRNKNVVDEAFNPFVEEHYGKTLNITENLCEELNAMSVEDQASYLRYISELLQTISQHNKEKEEKDAIYFMEVEENIPDVLKRILSQNKKAE